MGFYAIARGLDIVCALLLVLLRLLLKTSCLLLCLINMTLRLAQGLLHGALRFLLHRSCSALGLFKAPLACCFAPSVAHLAAPCT